MKKNISKCVICRQTGQYKTKDFKKSKSGQYADLAMVFRLKKSQNKKKNVGKIEKNIARSRLLASLPCSALRRKKSKYIQQKFWRKKYERRRKKIG